jgi:hypothetical protein
LRQLLFEQASKLLGPFPASENASALKNDDVGRHVALDILFKAMLGGEAQMIFEDLRGGPTSQVVYHGAFLPPSWIPKIRQSLDVNRRNFNYNHLERNWEDGCTAFRVRHILA